jgi:hypothetical protein
LTAEGHDLRSEQVPSSFIQKVIDKVGSNSNAFVIDVGETKEGEWIVIELNAFEQSGLSENNPDILYSNLKTILK